MWTWESRVRSAHLQELGSRSLRAAMLLARNAEMSGAVSCHRAGMERRLVPAALSRHAAAPTRLRLRLPVPQRRCIAPWVSSMTRHVQCDWCCHPCMHAPAPTWHVMPSRRAAAAVVPRSPLPPHCPLDRSWRTLCWLPSSASWTWRATRRPWCVRMVGGRPCSPTQGRAAHSCAPTCQPPPCHLPAPSSAPASCHPGQLCAIHPGRRRGVCRP